MSTTPATLISEQTWTAINIYRNAAISGTAIVPNIQANATVGTQEYLGDANGNPTQVIPSIPSAGTPNLWVNKVLDLSEVVTRADGTTKLTIAALLDELATAVAGA